MDKLYKLIDDKGNEYLSKDKGKYGGYNGKEKIYGRLDCKSANSWIEKGYYVESKRGGGGYIRIRKIEMDRNEYLAGIHSSIDDKLSSADMRDILYDLYNKGIIILY